MDKSWVWVARKLNYFEASFAGVFLRVEQQVCLGEILRRGEASNKNQREKKNKKKAIVTLSFLSEISIFAGLDIVGGVLRIRKRMNQEIGK